MMIGQLIIALSIMIIAPVLFGRCIRILCRRADSPTMDLAYGWIFLLAAFELFAVPAIFLKATLTELCMYFSIFLICAAVFSIYTLCRKDGLRGKNCTGQKNCPVQTNRSVQKNCSMRTNRSEQKDCFSQKDCLGQKDCTEQKARLLSLDKKAPRNIYFWCAVVLVAFQLIMTVLYSHYDADDAYYIGTATTSLSTDTLFVYEPDNGILTYNVPPARYVFSALMLLWAYFSRISGVHPLIIAHTLAPPFLILMSYLVLWNIGKLLFKTEEQTSVFFLFLNVFHLFGFTSVYTQQSFFLLRIWQGKSMLPNIIFPVYFYLLLDLYKNTQNRRNWMILFIVSTAACCCSAMAVPLCLTALFCGTVLLSVHHREWKVLLYGFICCIPCFAVGTAYLLLR